MPIWRQIQRDNFTDWKRLFSFLNIDLTKEGHRVIPQSHFPLNLPLRLAEKIEKGRLDDPLLLQFLPLVEENALNPLFVSDPIADGSFRKKPKLLHKYHGRALLLCTSACAMHCRYCFRRHFDYDTTDKFFVEELALIAQDPSLSEILLSGGDPLSLGEVHLNHLMESLCRIPHVKRIRLHTRFPMGIPERIDAPLLKMLGSCTKQVFFTIHCNHPREFDSLILERLKEVQKLGIPVLTQTVLLKGINDNAETLQQLCELLVDNGIIPYYLHQLDRVQGAAHFEVPEEKGIALIKEIATRLPGYAVPKYVREVPHMPNKMPIQ